MKNLFITLAIVSMPLAAQTQSTLSIENYPITEKTLRCSQGYNPKTFEYYADMWLYLSPLDVVSAPFGVGGLAITKCRRFLDKLMSEAGLNGGSLPAQVTVTTTHTCSSKLGGYVCFPYSHRSVRLVNSAGHPFYGLGNFE